MHKRFKKFGLLLPKEFDDANTDKRIKDNIIEYLYKNERNVLDGPSRRKFKIKGAKENVNYQNASKQNAEGENKYRSNKDKFYDLMDKKHRRKESLSHTSETEIYYISPKDIKKHRRQHKSEEKLLEGKQNHSRKTLRKNADDKNEFGKGKKRHKDRMSEPGSKYISNKGNYQWLTKKEIFHLLNNPANTSNNVSAKANLLRDLILLDKSHLQLRPDEKPPKKMSFCNEDIINMLYPPSKRNATDGGSVSKRHSRAVDENPKKTKNEVKHKEKSQKRSPESNFIEQLATTVKEKIRDVHLTPQKHNNLYEKGTQISHKNLKKRSSQRSEIGSFVCGDIRNSINGTEKRRKSIQKSQETETEEILLHAHPKYEGLFFQDKATSQKIDKPLSNPSESSQSKGKSKSSRNKHETSTDVLRNESDRSTEQKKISRSSQKQHLVKNTFSVIHIAPVIYEGIEKKKTSKVFQKYYKYDNCRDHERANSATYKTFSDSHKMYQDTSEYSSEDTSKRRARKHEKHDKKYPPIRKRELKLETHISTVAVDPIPNIYFNSIENVADGQVNKFATMKSRIPVLNTYGKAVDQNKDILGSKLNSEVEAISGDKSITKNIRSFTPNDVEESSMKSRKPHRKGAQKILEDVERKFEDMCRVEKDKKKRSRENASSPRNKILDAPCGSKVSSFQPLISRAKENTSAKKSFARKFRQSHDTKETKTSESLNSCKEIKAAARNKKNDRKNRTASCDSRVAPIPTYSKIPTAHVYRQRSPTKTAAYLRREDRSPSRISNDCSSSMRSSIKQPAKNSGTSRSDTRLQPRGKLNKKGPRLGRSSTRASLSNSTVGDKSADSSRANTFLTKNYKDNDKLSRLQKSKQYSENLRLNLINKTKKTPPVAPQVMEVRYLTVFNDNSEEFKDLPAQPEATSKPFKDLYENDLSYPSLELVDETRFLELFQAPLNEALDEILNENYNFLRKKFSSNLNLNKQCYSDDELSQITEKTDNWYNFEVSGDGSLSTISYCCNSKVAKEQTLKLEPEDQIIDSCSAPGSEESGYSTIKSRAISTSFFEQPHIKALFHPQCETPITDFHLDVEMQTLISNHSGGEPDPVAVASKSLQTADIECSQTSIKLSREEIPETINFSERCGRLVADEFALVKEQGNVCNLAPESEQELYKDSNMRHSETFSINLNEIAILNGKNTEARKKAIWKQKFSFLSCVTCTSADQ